MPSAVEIARELVTEVGAGSLSPEEAILRLPATFLAPASLSLEIDPAAIEAYRGVAAGPGAAAGAIAFTVEGAIARAAEGVAVVLVVDDTEPEDIDAMRVVRGVIAVRSGLTGHAAIVSRGLGRPCLCGGSGMSIDRDFSTGVRSLAYETASGERRRLAETDVVSFDGGSGWFFAGLARYAPAGPEVDRVLGWASAIAEAAPIAEAPSVALASMVPTAELPSALVARAKRVLATRG